MPTSACKRIILSVNHFHLQQVLENTCIGRSVIELYKHNNLLSKQKAELLGSPE